MTQLLNKNIIVGITGGISAYKAPILVRRLKEKGAHVQCISTDSAKSFVTDLSLQAVSGHKVRHALFDLDAEAGMSHIELARWADIIIIAPTTANTMAQLAHGFTNDLLSTVCSATTAPIMLAPAMNQQMWANPINLDNVQRLKQFGFLFSGPESGDQACGENGLGRMKEPLDIVEDIEQYFCAAFLDLSHLKLSITAGPTWEAIDPVRGLTNKSSGTMGYALAKEAARYGADVTLISGPTTLATPYNVTRIDVISAQQMHDAVHASIASSDIFISVAAVADYRPVQQESAKIKKSQPQMQLSLERTVDILSSVSELKKRPFCVGFAAETNDLQSYALDKLKRKNLDLIVANQVGNHSGFGDIQTQCVIIDANEQLIHLGPATKAQLAPQIIHSIYKAYEQR